MKSSNLFISETPCFVQVTPKTVWNRTNATTLEGAKRLAAKRARGVTFTARVGTQTDSGEIHTLATLHETSAITRRRAVWRNA